MTYCCEEMTRQMHHACTSHPDLADCPDSLIAYSEDTHQFGLRVHDGGRSVIDISHCPWCGANLVERVSHAELGPPALKVGRFQVWVHGREFPDEQDSFDASWLRITAHCGGAGASIWVQGALLRVTEISQFGLACEALHQRTADRAAIEPLEPGLGVRLVATDAAGHIGVEVDITPDHLSQTHRLRFEIDQSFLPAIAAQCAAIARRYPVPGRPEG
jgi:hypothetical protein